MPKCRTGLQQRAYDSRMQLLSASLWQNAGMSLEAAWRLATAVNSCQFSDSGFKILRAIIEAQRKT